MQTSKNYMPLQGALLISNPRKTEMALALDNTSRAKGRIKRIARVMVKELGPAAVFDGLAAPYVSEFLAGAGTWTPGTKYGRHPNRELQAMDEDQRREFYKNLPDGNPEAHLRAQAAVADVFRSMPGYSQKWSNTWRGSKSSHIKQGKKRAYKEVTARKARWERKAHVRTARGDIVYKRPKAGDTVVTQVTNVAASRKYNAARIARKAALAYGSDFAMKNPRRSRRSRKNPGSWGEYAGDQFNYKTGYPKGSGTLITRGFGGPPIVDDADSPYIPSWNERRRNAKKAAKTNRWLAHVKKVRSSNPRVKGSALLKLASASYTKKAAKTNRSRSNPLAPPHRRRRPAKGTKAYYRAKHAIANNYGALALDNYGALALDNYGALALDNPYGALALDNYGALALDNYGALPFVRGVAADAGKWALVGLAGGLGHAMLADKVETLIEKVPVVGEKLLDLQVPEMVPLIGGMELDNTVSGLLTGGIVVAASQVLGRKFNVPMLTSYGTALGLGIAAAGPIIDLSGSDSSDEEEELGGLALENYGALTLENEGTFGDGMAYQIGGITSGDDADEYGQASLADAYYSGADFDLGEGQALVNGRSFFRRRFGQPSRRVSPLGGKSASASHLASKPGHRWGWLIKMIGWANVQKLAAMSPKQRVSVIKQLRENALATFKQLQAEAPGVPAPELAPAGADGVGGAQGAYGATVFGGPGM